MDPLTDGAIFLRPFDESDAAAHLAGEDDAMARWATGGRSTIETVERFIARSREQWQTGGPRRTFGVFDCDTERLIGFVEANLARVTEPGAVNVSYGIFNDFRGRGLAGRAIRLIARYLKSETDCREIVLRIAPENAASLRVAEKSGFGLCGIFDEPEGRLIRYSRGVSELAAE